MRFGLLNEKLKHKSEDSQSTAVKIFKIIFTNDDTSLPKLVELYQCGLLDALHLNQGMVAAARINRVDIIDFLLSVGADLDFEQGEALSNAALMCQLKAIDVLIERGASVNDKVIGLSLIGDSRQSQSRPDELKSYSVTQHILSHFRPDDNVANIKLSNVSMKGLITSKKEPIFQTLCLHGLDVADYLHLRLPFRWFLMGTKHPLNTSPLNVIQSIDDKHPQKENIIRYCLDIIAQQ